MTLFFSFVGCSIRPVHGMSQFFFLILSFSAVAPDINLFSFWGTIPINHSFCLSGGRRRQNLPKA